MGARWLPTEKKWIAVKGEKELLERWVRLV